MPAPIIGMIAATAAQEGLNFAGNAVGNAMQVGQQRKLNDLNFEYNKKMTDYNYEKQMQMWHDTNYAAQVAEMNKAGLNPGLMYKGAGQGQTATAVSNNSPSQANNKVENANIAQTMGMGMQLELLKAQKENIEADTKLKEADATKTAGADTNKTVQETENLKQQLQLASEQTKNEKTKGEILKLEESIKGVEEHIAVHTMNDVIAQAHYKSRQMWAAARQMETDADIKDATKENVIKLTAMEITSKSIQNALMLSEINLNQATIKKMSADIANKVWELGIAEGHLDIEKAFKEFNTDWGNIIGKEALETVKAILQAIGLGKVMKASTPTRNPIGFQKQY